MTTCQHCDTEASDQRTFCPACRRRMRAVAAPAVVPVVTAVADDVCAYCRRGPARMTRFYSVEAYVVMFRWSSVPNRRCYDCALEAFRAAQYRCLLRGWWGLTLAPLANLIALACNLMTWRRMRHVSAPAGAPTWAREVPVRRRLPAYVATTLAATLVTLGIGQPLVAASSTSPAAAVPSVTSASPVAHAPATPPPDAAPKPDAVALPGQSLHEPLTRLLLHTPSGWDHVATLRLPVRKLAKQFKSAVGARHLLRQLGYVRGVETGAYSRTRHVALDEHLLQFHSTDSVMGWYFMYLRANGSRGGAFHKSFAIRGLPGARGLLCRSRDPFGLSYGVAVMPLGDLLIQVRYEAVSQVTSHQLSRYLRRAFNSVAGHSMHWTQPATRQPASIAA